MQDSEKLRVRLKQILPRQPIGIVHLAKEIGIGFYPLKNFLAGAQGLHFKTLLKIEGYILKKEAI